VLDSYFKLTNKSYLIHRFWYDLIRFFDHLVVAYFFGPPCTFLFHETDALYKILRRCIHDDDTLLFDSSDAKYLSTKVLKYVVKYFFSFTVSDAYRHFDGQTGKINASDKIMF